MHDLRLHLSATVAARTSYITCVKCRTKHGPKSEITENPKMVKAGHEAKDRALLSTGLHPSAWASCREDGRFTRKSYTAGVETPIHTTKPRLCP